VFINKVLQGFEDDFSIHIWPNGKPIHMLILLVGFTILKGFFGVMGLTNKALHSKKKVHNFGYWQNKLVGLT
jgi:hypothetical protein